MRTALLWKKDEPNDIYQFDETGKKEVLFKRLNIYH